MLLKLRTKWFVVCTLDLQNLSKALVFQVSHWLHSAHLAISQPLKLKTNLYNEHEKPLKNALTKFHLEPTIVQSRLMPFSAFCQIWKTHFS